MDDPARRSQLVTCLWFTGQAEEAARFYVGAFAAYRPGSAVDQVQRNAADVVTPDGTVHGRAGEVQAVSFTLDGQPFVALDDPARPVEHTDAVSFQVLCSTQEEVDHFWDTLSLGGREVACGWLQDRYGVRWQVVPAVLPELLAGEDRDAAARVQRVLQDMVRPSIERLLDAARDASGADEEQ
ncbi:VOC family protein [Citricoccus sp. SGAir0253]|uniref:VOC family protein n=1 Tax=Citricoccus sp. SGAir0253 TaxID=2567881 RepID=UPI0010CD24CE|nr:VOC family protein [Citricoccus sp. SGAir0253]QCU77311.1 VOC family protein [Citricoccus sp. SGAir0253]